MLHSTNMLLILVSAITIALVIERITFAWVSLLFHLFNQGPDRKSTWFVGALVQNTVGLLSTIASAVSRLFSISLKGLLFLTILLVVWGVAFVVARHSAVALIAFQRAYNSDVGGALRLALVIPMQLLQLIWDGLVPAYNLIVYCIKTIPTRILLENVLRNISDFEGAMLNLGLFVKSMTISLIAYVELIITPPDSFDPNLRLLDLISPLAYWRLVVSFMLKWLGDVCSVASSLGDLVAYPFLDINFGLGVHHSVNALLTLVIQTPAVTIQRCNAGAGQVVYCLPDFEPAIELAVNGVRHFGLMFDNWLDVATIIIQALLTGTSPQCSGWMVVDFETKGGLMGNNETVIVGVDENHFAKTDGWNIEVYSRTSVQGFPAAFPALMNVEYGIAVVTVNANVQGLLGCSCTDQAYGLQLLCAVAPLDTLTPSYFVPVEFQIPTTSFYMGCTRAKIRLDSIRWPVSRVTSPNSDARRSSTAQAALYVRPMCSSEGIDVVCVDTFKLAGCFPYCMALWTRGYLGSMVLRDGEEWANTVSMVSRDCGLHTWDLVSGELVAVTQNLRHKSGVTSTWMDAEVQLNGSHCQYAPNTFSRMMKESVPSYSDYRSVRLSGQPFAFAGDLILTAVNTVGDVWGVDVQRIYGNQVSSSEITRLNRCMSSSVSGPQRSVSSMHWWMRASRARLCSASRSARSNLVFLRARSSTHGATCAILYSARMIATARRVWRSTVRLGSMSKSCRAFGMLMSLRCTRFSPICRSVKRSAVSDLTTTRARVCDAFLRSFPVRVEMKSSASMYPSSVMRTSIPGATLSNEMFSRKRIVILNGMWGGFI
jgi:hypothetical protein